MHLKAVPAAGWVSSSAHIHLYPFLCPWGWPEGNSDAQTTCNSTSAYAPKPPTWVTRGGDGSTLSCVSVGKMWRPWKLVGTFRKWLALLAIQITGDAGLNPSSRHCYKLIHNFEVLHISFVLCGARSTSWSKERCRKSWFKVQHAAVPTNLRPDFS